MAADQQVHLAHEGGPSTRPQLPGDSKTFLKVQDMFAARTGRGVREVRHRHYLKGTLVCAVCGRGLSIQRSKGQYVYFYCLGQKDRRRPTGCKEAYIPAEKLERQVEDLYQRVQLPKKWAERLRASIEEEIIARQDRNSAERDFLTRTLAKLETERRKLLSAYYAGAIDVSLLRTEQERITREVHDIEQRMAAVEATLAEWQEILAIALKFATNCARAYRSANERTRKLYNAAVFDKLLSATARSPRSSTASPSNSSSTRPSSNNDVWSGRRGSNPRLQPWEGCPANPNTQHSEMWLWSPTLRLLPS